MGDGCPRGPQGEKRSAPRVEIKHLCIAIRAENRRVNGGVSETVFARVESHLYWSQKSQFSMRYQIQVPRFIKACLTVNCPAPARSASRRPIRKPRRGDQVARILASTPHGFERSRGVRRLGLQN